MSDFSPGICFVNAALAGRVTSLRVVGDRIAALGVSPVTDDRVVDLGGDRLLPGLINAHDHLQFNNFPRTRYRAAHRNVREWIEDLSANRRRDAGLVAAESLALSSRLMVGGLKNLLSGVTTVAHHDAVFDALNDPVFPVHVLRKFGWAHSLSVCAESEVAQSERATPAGWPWIIHAGEGVDAVASGEFARLEELGCVGARSLLVHALGFDDKQLQRLMARGACVVWCPTSNKFLFGRTLDPQRLFEAGNLALGSDSRLSGGCDLLAELRAARDASSLDDQQLESLVTRGNARRLRLSDRGALEPGLLADLLVIPSDAALTDIDRCDLRLVMVGGRMKFGDADIAAALAPDPDCVPVALDGRHMVLERRLAEAVSRSAWREPGLSISDVVGRAA